MDSRLTRHSVYGLLRERIVAGELPPGAPLVASQLAASVGASRTPVREALLRLMAEGLATETPAGFVVRKLTEENIMEMYEVRVPLEATAARLAAANLTPLGLAQIRAVHGKLTAAASQESPDLGWVAAVNLEFHRAICSAARNTLLLEFISKMYDSLGRFRSTTFQYPGRLPEAMAEHEQMVAAIADRSPDRAEKIARDHMQRAMEIRLEMFREEESRRL